MTEEMAVTVDEGTVTSFIGVEIKAECNEKEMTLSVGSGVKPSAVIGVALALNFRLVMPCGQSYHLTNRLPTEDLPCSCGNPTHWFVKFQEQ